MTLTQKLLLSALYTLAFTAAIPPSGGASLMLGYTLGVFWYMAGVSA